MNRREFLKRMTAGFALAASGLYVLDELTEVEAPGRYDDLAHLFEWQDEEPIWSRISDGRKDAFYAYGTSYHQMLVTERPSVGLITSIAA